MDVEISNIAPFSSIGGFRMRAINGQAPLNKQGPPAPNITPSVPVPQLPPPEAPMQGHKQLADQLHLTHTTGHNALPFPLAQFQGTWTGVGFNMIFRPRPFDKTKNPPDVEFKNDVNTGPDDNILELNLTNEQWSFGKTIGPITNRGLGEQQDITLGGLPYLQTVQNVTNPSTGLGNLVLRGPEDGGLHFEPGVWLTCPPANFHASGPEKLGSVVRMGCVPHGTTINAQGLIPAQNITAETPLGGVKGKPNFDKHKLNTRPFHLGKPNETRFGTETFKSMKAEVKNPLREPADLAPFVRAGTITTAIIQNPNEVLKAVTDLQEILETITFTVSTGPPTNQLNGGGTSNISFLAGPQKPIEVETTTTTTTSDNNNNNNNNKKKKTEKITHPTNLNPGAGDNPNAHAEFLTNTWWISSVLYSVPVGATAMKKGQTRELSAVLPERCRAPAPRFTVTAGREIAAGETLKVPGLQMQYSQTVNLNFGPRNPGVLTWPHVSVATLVPTGAQVFTVR